MLETDVGFNRNMLRYTSNTLKEHNAEIISLKKQVQAAYEQTRTNEELSQNLIAQLTDQLEVAQNMEAITGLDLEAITGQKERLAEVEGTTT